MITFACKSINKEDLLRCSFGLNKTEYNVMIFLLDDDNYMTTFDIAKKMKLERTTVQKAIKNLVEKNIVSRKQENLDKGGYIFFYKIHKKEEIKYMLKKIVNDWHRKVEKFIDSL